MRPSLLVLLAFLFTAGPACTRYVVDASDDPRGRATLLETVQVRNFLIVQQVKREFWECDETKTGLKCLKVCDREDTEGNKIICPKVTAAGFSNPLMY